MSIFFSETRRRLIKGCLSFKMANFLHNGLYTLVAQNEFGVTNRSIRYHKEVPSKYLYYNHFIFLLKAKCFTKYVNTRDAVTINIK